MLGSRPSRRALLLLPILVAACGRSSLLDERYAALRDGGVVDLARFDRPAIPLDRCADGPRRLFVVDANGTLSRFRPDELRFTDVGVLRCPGESGTVNSMAVQQDGTAWVNYQSGGLFRVDTGNASCFPTGFVRGQGGFTAFGMGFAPRSPAPGDETLYVVGLAGGSPLARIDLLSLQLVRLSTLQTGDQSPELSGAPDGRLFAFFPAAAPPYVAQVLPATGELRDRRPLRRPFDPAPSDPRSWAFAYWGGEFWIFLRRAEEASTKVYQLRDDGTVVVQISSTSRNIVGAGVSTCQPVP